MQDQLEAARPVARTWHRHRSSDRPRFAALDLGTNNCRLLIAEQTREGFIVVDSFSRITRLGERLAVTETLSEGAIARTLQALSVCRRIIDRNRVVRARCVATEACRRARNGAAFLDLVLERTGIALEVIDHDDEARLALLGCLPLIEEEARHLLMVDIGGGSTEIMWLDRMAADGPQGDTISLPIGVVTLCDTFADGMAAERYAAMVGHVRDALARLPARRGRPQKLAAPTQMLGTSGTVTTLAAVHLGLRRYDRRKVDGLRLTFEAIAHVGRRLRALNETQRAAHPCIGSGRADLVVAGCAILDAIHAEWPIDRLRVADRGVREGILNSLMGRSLEQLMRPVERLPVGA